MPNSKPGPNSKSGDTNNRRNDSSGQNSRGHTSPTRELPSSPALEQLRKQARELLRACRAEDADAKAEVTKFEHQPAWEKFALADAQRVLARTYGFLSWRHLKRHVDAMDIKRFTNAVSNRDFERVRELAAVRPELVEIEIGDERIALHLAVDANDAEMTKLLMELGSDANKGVWPHRDATSAATIARARGYDEIEEIIADEQRRRLSAIPDENANKDLDGRNAKLSKTAVEAGDLEAIRKLHAEGQLVNDIDFIQGGLLSLAVRNDDFAMLKLLIECGLDLDERKSRPVANGEQVSWGMPLWFSSTHGRHEMAEWLIAHGADVNAVVYACGDALCNADEMMKKILLDAGARVNVEHVAGWRDIDLAERILNGDAAAQSLNSSAAQSGDGNVHPEIASCFLWTAAYHGVPEIVERCLVKLDRELAESSWHYNLMQPLRIGNRPKNSRSSDQDDFFNCFQLMLEYLNENGKGPDVLMNGSTVLHHLATSAEPTEAERVRFAKMLLDAGASLTIRDSGTLKSSPLGWACRWGRTELVRLYLGRGAVVDEPDAESWATPLARAIANGHEEIAELIRNRRN